MNPSYHRTAPLEWRGPMRTRLLRRFEALVLGDRELGAGEILAPALGDGGTAAGRVGEHRELVHVLVVHRREGEVRVLEALGIVLDLLADAPALPRQAAIDPELAPGF